jgi:hypothetical protein
MAKPLAAMERKKMPNYETNQQAETTQRIQQITHTALDVLESVMTDVETPVSIRLEAAFKFFQMFEVKPTDLTSKTVTQDFETNALQLAQLSALLKGNNILSAPVSTAIN